MVEQNLTHREARNISHDTDLPDAESEILRDLLADDEVFAALVTVQQNAVLVSGGEHDVGDDVERLAGEAAGAAGAAIDEVVTARIDDAQRIGDLAEELNESWLIATKLYQAGYETTEALAGVSQSALVDVVPHSAAARVQATLDTQEVSGDADA
ncbi:hypothetical protein [Haloarcula sp. CBA1122]|uniref:hypothetical protein n=1 Tax=Haloarcula sp. CBA1122 TaxID=2668069 RepID=UPI00130BD905|nr:hypothetical protein [Haloarcula sp. CBA1122]MUV51354.1 hypothetical protein [Haloarcula sp. CBA1122]